MQCKKHVPQMGCVQPDSKVCDVSTLANAKKEMSLASLQWDLRECAQRSALTLTQSQIRMKMMEVLSTNFLKCHHFSHCFSVATA